MDRVQRGQARETRHQTFGKRHENVFLHTVHMLQYDFSWLWHRINSKTTRSSLHDKPLRLHLSPCPLPVGGGPATPCSSATKRLAAGTAKHRRIQLFCLQILPPNMGCACQIARDRSTTPMTLGIQPGFGFKPRECRCRWTKSSSWVTFQFNQHLVKSWFGTTCPPILHAFPERVAGASMTLLRSVDTNFCIADIILQKE